MKSEKKKVILFIKPEYFFYNKIYFMLGTCVIRFNVVVIILLVCGFLYSLLRLHNYCGVKIISTNRNLNNMGKYRLVLKSGCAKKSSLPPRYLQAPVLIKFLETLNFRQIIETSSTYVPFAR